MTVFVLIIVFLQCFEPTHFIEDSAFWYNKAQKELDSKLNREPNTNVARNIILFLGDGMGVSTVTAARIYKGQQNGQSGEESELTFEKFPHTGLLKTYNTDQQVPDSAGTATAFLCGIKTKAGTLGVDDNVQYDNCTSSIGSEVTSILDWSLIEGKSVGLVTTTRITHATPAAAYAHSARRSWEGDTEMNPANDCKDIAYQLVKDNPDIQVVLGGGRRYLLSKNETDPEYNVTRSEQRMDTSLVQDWIKDKESRNKTHVYTWRKREFDMVDAKQTDFLLGLFEPSHMQYEHQRDNSSNGEPSLEEMTVKAIEILQKNEKGFFLLVEGGRIDHGHHGTYGRRALEETVMFDKAVLAAMEMTSQEETLIVVTADHSHVFAMAGYPSRGNDILGLVDNEMAGDGMPYTSLVYGNGQEQRRNLSNVDTKDYNFRQTSALYMSSETHGGEDVPVYALGPMSHLFTGTHEQNFIPHAMAYAACVGQNKNHCLTKTSNTASKRNGTRSDFLALLIICFYLINTSKIYTCLN